jgi:hypothetical protein
MLHACRILTGDSRCMLMCSSLPTSRHLGCCCVQGRYKEQHVAVKRCKIGKAADLLSFQQEVTLLSQMRHPGIVSLLAAKALPPGSTLSCMMTFELVARLVARVPATASGVLGQSQYNRRTHHLAHVQTTS